MYSGMMRGFVVNSLTTVIIKMYSDETDHFDTTGSIMAFLSTSILIGSMIGSLIASYIIMKFGRKNTLLWFSILSLITNAMSMIPVHWCYLATVKILNGLCSSIVVTTVPMLFGEFVAPNLRGLFTSFINFFITFAIMVSSIIELLIVRENNSKLFIISFIPATIVSAVISVMCFWVKETNSSSSLVIEADIHSTIFSKYYIYCWIIALAIGPTQAGSGINPVVQYASLTFADIFDSPYSGTIGQVMVTSAQTLIAIILLPLIKRVRRRVLWFVSIFGTIICLVTELVFEVVKVNQKVIVPIKISLTGLYLVFYFIGLGPLFMVIQAEIFPKAVKTQFMNITMSISWVVYIITTQIYPLIPFWSSYAIYIGIGMFALLYCSNTCQKRTIKHSKKSQQWQLKNSPTKYRYEPSYLTIYNCLYKL
ncbi:Hexose_transporter [Hexamita inflata]|uniref:Hexose transporter n=1 Tax=Hexamita inflata TaxID=28002 RepID=A0AA86TYY7_9EUKA|nr:Hexose transporter [Hexamita inflata]